MSQNITTWDEDEWSVRFVDHEQATTVAIREDNIFQLPFPFHGSEAQLNKEWKVSITTSLLPSSFLDRLVLSSVRTPYGDFGHRDE